MDDLNRENLAETNPEGEASVPTEEQTPALEVANHLEGETPAWEGEALAEPALSTPPVGQVSNLPPSVPSDDTSGTADLGRPWSGEVARPTSAAVSLDEGESPLPWDVSDAAMEEADEPLPAQAPILALDPSFTAPRLPARPLPAALVMPPQHERSPAWTIPVMCVGMAIIAACLIVPATETNRRMAYEQKRLKMDLEQIEKQMAVNEEFLHKVKDDPTLAQRLALRQMKMIRSGTTTLNLKDGPGMADLNPSPFSILAVPPPPQLEPYQPRTGFLSKYCLDPKMQMYLIGAGLMMIAGGLIMGASTVPAIRNMVGAVKSPTA